MIHMNIKNIDRSVNSLKHGTSSENGGSIISILEDLEIKGILEDSKQEKVGVVCSLGRKKSKFTLLDAVADEVSATLDVSVQKVREWCPKPNVLTFVHTHNLGTGMLSNADRKSATDLFVTGMGDGLCAIGIDKISCHYPQTSTPLVIDIPMRKTFYRKLLRGLSEEQNAPEKGKSGGSLSSRSVYLDSLWCSKIPRKRGLLACQGKNWKKGLRSFDVGTFSRVLGVDVTMEHHPLSGVLVIVDDRDLNDEASMHCGIFGSDKKNKAIVCAV